MNACDVSGILGELQ